MSFGGTDGGKGWRVFDDDQYCLLVRHEVSFVVCHIASNGNSEMLFLKLVVWKLSRIR